MSQTPESRRIDELETIVVELRHEVEELRAEVRATVRSELRSEESRAEALPVATARLLGTIGSDAAGTGAGVARWPGNRRAGGGPAEHEPAVAALTTPLPLAEPRRAASVASLDLEALVGRYGTLALATLAILMALGAFLGWAISNGKLGPTSRVVLGAIAALAIAGLGLWLRRRGTVRFGNVLLALSVALMHVDAWGAGPQLHVLSSSAALVLAAAASVALAALALRADEETLFSVGTGGALLAPFVTSQDPGSALTLVTYGWVVLAAGLYAVRSRSWRAASWVMILGCVVYVFAAIGLARGAASWTDQIAPTAFALACGWAAFAWGGDDNRRGFTLVYLGMALVALLVSSLEGAPVRQVVALATLGTATAYLALQLTDFGPRGDFLGALLLPLGFLGAVIAALPRPAETQAAVFALTWTGAAVVAAHVRGRDLRRLHLTVAGLASAAAILLSLYDRPLLCIIALAAHAAVLSVVLWHEPQPMLLWPIAADLLIASAWAHGLLAARPAFLYRPFLGSASAAALAAVLGWIVASRIAAQAVLSDSRHGAGDRALVASLGAIAAFLWGYVELRTAFSRDVATFLLIVYFASVGVLTIFVGRRRQRAPLRRIGLALAVYAALQAVAEAWTFDQIGLRVGSYLIVGSFLLAVAYWYRASEAPASSPSRTVERHDRLGAEPGT